jgi:hypothetical protein
MPQTISLQAAEGMIGDVPQAVSYARQARGPSPSASRGSAIAAMINNVRSDKRTNMFFQQVLKEDPDITYQEFVKKAARAGVVSNPRIAAYSEVLKEKANWKNAERLSQFERNRQQQQEEDKTRRELARGAKVRNAMSQIALDFTGDESSTDYAGTSIEVIDKYRQDPIGYVEKVMKTVTGGLKDEDQLTKEEQKEIRDHVSKQLHQEAQRRSAEEQTAMAAEAAGERAKISAEARKKDETAKNVESATRNLRRFQTSYQTAVKMKDKETQELVRGDMLNAKMDVEAYRRVADNPSTSYEQQIENVRREQATRYVDILNTDPKRINKEFKTGFDFGRAKNETEFILQLLREIGIDVQQDNEDKWYITSTFTTPESFTRTGGVGLKLGKSKKMSTDEILNMQLGEKSKPSAE